MPSIPTKITDLSSTAVNNYPSGSEAIGTSLDNYLRGIQSIQRLESKDYEWNKPEYTTVYASATTFTIAGTDVTSIYAVNRRVRAVGTLTGTIYGTITDSVFSTNTTVTVSWDSGTLSSETLVISLGLGVTNVSIPNNYITTAKIADSNVTTAKIADSNVTTAKINDAAVTTAKVSTTLVNGLTAATDLQGADQLIFADNSASDVNKKITVTNARSYLTPITTRGDIIRGSSSNLAERLALGSAGKVLISDGTDLTYDYMINVVRKTTTETRGGVSGLSNDSVLVATLAANKIYHIRIQATSTYGAQDGGTFPVGISASNSVSSVAGTLIAINPALGKQSNIVGTFTSLNYSKNVPLTGGSISGDPSYIGFIFEVYIANSSSSNTIGFQWGANASGQNNSIYAGSILTYQVIG